MALLVGAILAVAVGLERDRAFYPTVTIVVASYYVLFAVMGASAQVLVLESLVAAAFLAAAVSGFRSSLWVVVAALAAHGVFDLAHSGVIAKPRRAGLVAGLLSHLRCGGSGVPGMAAQEQAHSGCGVDSRSRQPSTLCPSDVR